MGQERIPGGSDRAPALVDCGDITLAAWKGEDDSTLWFSYATPGGNGQLDWGPQAEISGIATSDGPALATLAGKIWMAWKGGGDDTRIWVSSWDPAAKKWGTPAGEVQWEVVDGTSVAPALVATGSELYLVWKGEGNNQQLWWSKSATGQAGSWTPQAVLSGVGAAGDTPALAVNGNDIYLAWLEGNGGKRLFWSHTGDGLNWTEQSPISTVGGAGSGPALAVDTRGALRVTWREEGSGSRIFTTALGAPDGGGSDWSPQAWVPDIETDNRPALASPTAVMGWKAAGSDKLYYGQLDRLVTQSHSYLARIDGFLCNVTRSGSFVQFLDPSADTDYVTLTVQVAGSTKQLTQTVRAGNFENGNSYRTPLILPPFEVPDNGQVVLSYLITNSSQDEADVIKYLGEAGEKVASAAATAAGSAAGAALGVAIGLALGTGAVPIIGSAVGALAGFLVGAAWPVLFPNCDGPVAAGVHVFSASDLIGHPASAQDSHTGLRTQDGCGASPNYDVTWSIVPTG